MKKRMIYFIIIAAIIATINGCFNETPKKFKLKQLTRVDVQFQNGDDRTIAGEEKIKILRKVFAEIDWDKNANVEKARKEDLIATLFFTYDKNMPERLFEYLIWFNQSNETATIIDKEKSILGKLDKENAKILKDILMNN